MSTKSNRRFLTSMVAVMQLMMSILWVIPATMAHAQTIDSEPPIIDFEAVSQGFLGDSQVFTATVSDDIQLDAVTLYFRFDSEENYESREMRVLGNTNIFTTTIETKMAPTGTSSIEYYMEALDAANNRTLQGFAFDPIERELIITPVASTGAVVAPQTGMSLRRKLAYGAIGLVVVGALASSSGGSSGTAAQSGVPVTINVQELP